MLSFCLATYNIKLGFLGFLIKVKQRIRAHYLRKYELVLAGFESC